MLGTEFPPLTKGNTLASHTDNIAALPHANIVLIPVASFSSPSTSGACRPCYVLAEVGCRLPLSQIIIMISNCETFHRRPAGSSVRDGLGEEQESNPLLDMHAVQNTTPAMQLRDQ
jgi:hypothetical protein